MKSLPSAWAMAACLFGCAENVSPPTVAQAGPCAEARAWEDELRGSPTEALIKVDGTYSWDTCSGMAQVTGTRLLMRHPESASSERLNRLLECSSARILVSGPPEGLLPEGLVEIEVRPGPGNVEITLRADSVAKNIRLLHRAQALTKPRRAGGS